MAPYQLDNDTENRRRAILEDLSPSQLETEDLFDHVAEAMATTCGVPKAHVSLMKSESQHVIGEVGLDTKIFDRENAFCNYALGEREILIVENAAEDERFRDNPLVVDAPYIRFYAGIPIVVDETPVGTLCALDSVPGSIDYAVRSALFDLVRQLEQYLQMRYVYPAEDPKLQMATVLATLEARMTSATQHGACEHVDEMVASSKGQIRNAYDLLERLTSLASDDIDERLGLQPTSSSTDP